MLNYDDPTKFGGQLRIIPAKPDIHNETLLLTSLGRQTVSFQFAEFGRSEIICNLRHLSFKNLRQYGKFLCKFGLGSEF